MSYEIQEYHGEYNRTTRTKEIEYIVVHYTGSGSSADGNALANCKYFAGGNRNSSSHYFIDDANIYEYLDPDDYAAWHCGGGDGPIYNSNSIGIEICQESYSTEPFTDEEIARLTWLVQKLMDDYDIPAENVVRHYDVTGKKCPYAYVMDSSMWTELHAEITGEKIEETESEEAESLDVDGLWGQETTKALQTVLGTTVDGIVSSQSSSYKDDNPGLLASSWDWTSDASGSPMIVAMQAKLGTTTDGLIGPKTIKALQNRMGTTADGCISKPSDCVKALQTKLNEGEF